MWPRNILSPKAAKLEYPMLWDKAQELLPELDDESIAKVVSLASDTCPACAEDSTECQCWNDE